MAIFTSAVSLTTLLIIGAILFRARHERLFRSYPVFYMYVAYVALSTLALFPLYMMSSRAYMTGYWTSEFVSILFGFGVTWEIYGAVLGPCRGVRRLGRRLIAALYFLAIAKFAGDVSSLGLRVLIPTMAEFERNVRFLQALLLFAVLALAFYYRVPMGRNVGCLTAGYSFFIGSALVNLTLRSTLGARFQNWWAILQPVEYMATVGLWCAGLWVRSPGPAPSGALERDYARASRETAEAIGRLRGWLEGALRQ